MINIACSSPEDGDGGDDPDSAELEESGEAGVEVAEDLVAPAEVVVESESRELVGESAEQDARVAHAERHERHADCTPAHEAEQHVYGERVAERADNDKERVEDVDLYADQHLSGLVRVVQQELGLRELVVAVVQMVDDEVLPFVVELEIPVRHSTRTQRTDHRIVAYCLFCSTALNLVGGDDVLGIGLQESWNIKLR